MRTKRRISAVLAVTAIGALAAVGIALAADGTSTVSFKFTKVPAGSLGKSFKSGKLNVHTHMTYNKPNTDTKRAQLYFDNDLKFNTGAAPVCNKDLSGKNMKEAMALCGSSLVGTGTATANVSTPGDTHACVLGFNAKIGGKAGIELLARAKLLGTINCSNPKTNTNGDTTILLQAPFGANPDSLGADYKGGKWLDFDGSAIPSGTPLSDFNVTIQKGSYVQGKCGDSNKQLNMKTVFTYTRDADPNNPPPPVKTQQTVLSKQVCT
jgi:hypothetical protein